MADKFKACSVEGCNGNAHRSASAAKGLCSAHYMRFKRHGAPLAGGTPKGELMRFITEVALKHTGNECLTWPFATNEAGRGVIRIAGKRHIASRYVCELVNGPPPTSEHEAAHSCGKGHEGCIAPEHLSWKTSKENKADQLVHNTRSRGERNGVSKLTEVQVSEILTLKGSMTQKEIAVMFGISPGNVSAIHRRISWAHV